MGILKLLIGVLLLVVPLGLYAYEIMGGEIGAGIYLWKSLWTVIQGTIPPFIMLIGLFVVWLELDEWRIEKELRIEEAKEAKKTKNKTTRKTTRKKK